jgi:hypothetical protein
VAASARHLHRLEAEDRVIRRVGQLPQVHPAAAGDRPGVRGEDPVVLGPGQLDGAEPVGPAADADLALARSADIARPVRLAQGRDEVARTFPLERRVHRHRQPPAGHAAPDEEDGVRPEEY